MSMSYLWRPIPTPPPPGTIRIGLADMLTRRYIDDPGPDVSADRAQLHGLVLTAAQTDWLYGVLVAEDTSNDICEDVQRLIEAITEHGRIMLEIER